MGSFYGSHKTAPKIKGIKEAEEQFPALDHGKGSQRIPWDPTGGGNLGLGLGLGFGGKGSSREWEFGIELGMGFGGKGSSRGWEFGIWVRIGIWDFTL